MYKIVFLIIVVVLLTSCMLSSIPEVAYIAERRFIDDMLKNPEKIDSIIDNSIYYSAKKRKMYLNDDTLRKYSSYMKTFKEKGYSYLYYNEVICTSEPVNIIHVKREIKIKCRGEDLYLNFFFYSENDTLRLDGFTKMKENEIEWYNRVNGTNF